MSGRYFSIQSDLNDMALDLSGSDASSGNSVVMWPLHGNDNQLWYQDVIYNTIRTKVDDDYVLDINDDNRLVVNEFDPDAPNQRWLFFKNRVVNLESGEVLDIVGGNDDSGAEVCQWKWKEAAHQTFSINYVEPKEFVIRSKLNGKAMDVKRSDTDPGASIIMYDQHGNDNQVWYEGRDGTIHSKLNSFVISSEDNTFQLQPYDGTLMERQWIKLGSRIVNRFEPQKAADIKGRNDDNGAEICGWDFHGEDHQLWEYEWL